MMWILRRTMTIAIAVFATAAMTGCATLVSDEARCERDVPLAKAASDALLEYEAAVPVQVGEAVTPLILSVFAGCGR